MENGKKMYVTAEEAAEMLGVSTGYAYKIIRGLNEELKGKKRQRQEIEHQGKGTGEGKAIFVPTGQRTASVQKGDRPRHN